MRRVIPYLCAVPALLFGLGAGWLLGYRADRDQPQPPTIHVGKDWRDFWDTEHATPVGHFSFGPADKDAWVSLDGVRYPAVVMIWGESILDGAILADGRAVVIDGEPENPKAKVCQRK